MRGTFLIPPDGKIEAACVVERANGKKAILGRTIVEEERFMDKLTTLKEKPCFPTGHSGARRRISKMKMFWKNLRTLSIGEWLVCAMGMFFMGLGMGYIDVQVYNYGIGFFIFGLVLEIPAFYLVFKHKL